MTSTATRFDMRMLREPQTSRISTLDNEYLTGMLEGITPARLADALREADAGNLFAQHRIFADMRGARRAPCRRDGQAQISSA
ncbi:hypothetical protein [Dentiradicibacter hellwigii]|uniref:FXSXX-COOH protein n=1 Tax=Dentiradicibacter hellwigii TaxID=3149053 RepID=A0ABV4UA65_9RHOO